MSYIRPDGKVWVSISIENWQKPGEHITAVRKAAEGLLEAEVGWDSEDGLQVTGVREATPEDLAELERQKERDIRGARQRLRDLRRNYPSLFDKQGNPLEDIGS